MLEDATNLPWDGAKISSLSHRGGWVGVLLNGKEKVGQSKEREQLCEGLEEVGVGNADVSVRGKVWWSG